MREISGQVAGRPSTWGTANTLQDVRLGKERCRGKAGRGVAGKLRDLNSRSVAAVHLLPSFPLSLCYNTCHNLFYWVSCNTVHQVQFSTSCHLPRHTISTSASSAVTRPCPFFCLLRRVYLHCSFPCYISDFSSFKIYLLTLSISYHSAS